MVRAGSHIVSRVMCYSGALLELTGISLTRLSRSLADFSKSLNYPCLLFMKVLLPRGSTPGLGSSAFARHYLRNRFLFLFLRLLRCFTSAGFAFITLCVQVMTMELFSIRLPHSDTPGSSLACSSPRLFAACCVLLRLSAPRHSP